MKPHDIKPRKPLRAKTSKKPVNIHQAKTHLSRLLARVAKGEEIVIAKAGKPVARLVPIEPEKPKKRVLGADGAGVWIAPDFDTFIPPGWEEIGLAGVPVPEA